MSLTHKQRLVGFVFWCIKFFGPTLAPQQLMQKESVVFWCAFIFPKGSPLAILAPEGHFDRVPVTCVLVEGLTGLEGRGVEVQADAVICVAGVFHTVDSHIITNVSDAIFWESVDLLYSQLGLFLGVRFWPIE